MVNPPAGAMSSVVFRKEVSYAQSYLIFFINNMPDKITSMIHLFADDTKTILRRTNQNQTNDE